MTAEIKVPSFPESVADGRVAAWHKKPGETFERDEVVAEVETDKVMFEVPAPARGRLTNILADVGATVLSGAVMGEFEAVDTLDTADAPAAPASEPAKEPAMTPSARKRIEEEGLDPNAIVGTGKNGRILKEDVLETHAAPAEKAAQSAPAARPVPAPVVAAVVPAGPRQDRRVPMTRLRAKIAERLVQVQHTAAILTTFNEIDMAPVMDLRNRYRDSFEKRHGVRLGFMSFFVKAATEALKRYPEVNASIEGDDIVYHDYYDIGVAVASSRGLVVPVLRDADALAMADIEGRISDFAKRAGDGKLDMEEITGGTFTITNGGVFGSLLSTPIINPPQSAILGMHKIEQRAVVVDGEIVARPMMYLALSYDHRIIDGSSAVRFLVTIKELLEDPARMLLDV
ncbi:MAG: 2-oxoglutarate dehydrogenase complex dihydrolipoyllysine-residue succinyltransferase [Gammaproteobacteria bacterium]|nr:2-oxoglutarate dehydrogenase complex dihydrolipoyllysine-residue succinyltransferase [Gammaproteobacteria bacterium]